MKYFVPALILAMVLIPSGETQSEQIGPDKGFHFAAGALIAQASYPAYEGMLKNKKAAMLCSFGTAFLANLAKEVADGRRFDGRDLAAGTLGGGSIFLLRFEW